MTRIFSFSYFAQLSNLEIESLIDAICRDICYDHTSSSRDFYEDYQNLIQNQQLVFNKSPLAFALLQISSAQRGLLQCVNGDTREVKPKPINIYTLLRNIAIADIESNDVYRESINLIAANFNSKQDAIESWFALYKEAQKKITLHLDLGFNLQEFSPKIDDDLRGQDVIAPVFSRLIRFPLHKNAAITTVQKKINESYVLRFHWNRPEIICRNTLALPSKAFRVFSASDKIAAETDIYGKRMNDTDELAFWREREGEFIKYCEKFNEMPDFTLLVFVPALMNYWLRKMQPYSKKLINIMQ